MTNLMRSKPKAKTIPNWSPSKLACYEECPRKARYKYIDKLPEPSSPVLERGTEIHESAEQYITGRSTKLHEGLQAAKVKKLLAELRKGYKANLVRVELELAFTKAWKLTSWLAPDVYCRFKLDVFQKRPNKPTRLLDWKTGRFKPDGEYADQLSAYSVAALSAGLAESTEAVLCFTDAGQTVDRPEGNLKLVDLPAAQKYWDRKAAAMLGDSLFKPTPGTGCKWCPYSRNRGGPCDY